MTEVELLGRRWTEVVGRARLYEFHGVDHIDRDQPGPRRHCEEIVRWGEQSDHEK